LAGELKGEKAGLKAHQIVGLGEYLPPPNIFVKKGLTRNYCDIRYMKYHSCIKYHILDAASGILFPYLRDWQLLGDKQ
jgi:hypothetical protein